MKHTHNRNDEADQYPLGVGVANLSVQLPMEVINRLKVNPMKGRSLPQNSFFLLGISGYLKSFSFKGGKTSKLETSAGPETLGKTGGTAGKREGGGEKKKMKQKSYHNGVNVILYTSLQSWGGCVSAPSLTVYAF